MNTLITKLVMLNYENPQCNHIGNSLYSPWSTCFDKFYKQKFMHYEYVLLMHNFVAKWTIFDNITKKNWDSRVNEKLMKVEFKAQTLFPFACLQYFYNLLPSFALFPLIQDLLFTGILARLIKYSIIMIYHNNPFIFILHNMSSYHKRHCDDFYQTGMLNGLLLSN